MILGKSPLKFWFISDFSLQLIACMHLKPNLNIMLKIIAYLDLCEMNGRCYSTYCDIICHSRKRVFLSSYIKHKWVSL